jgi:hypothetical protein
MDAADPGWRRLGALLVEAGLVSERDLVEALAEQERSGRRLGEVLVGRGLVSAAAVANALAEQQGSFLRTEHGFGTGLRALMGRDSFPDPEATPPEAPPLSPTHRSELALRDSWPNRPPLPTGHSAPSRGGRHRRAQPRTRVRRSDASTVLKRTGQIQISATFSSCRPTMAICSWSEAAPPQPSARHSNSRKPRTLA